MSGFYTDHVTIHTLDVVLRIDGVLPFVVGTLNREVIVRVEDIVAVAAELRTGVMLGIFGLVVRRLRILQSGPLDRTRGHHEGRITVLKHRGLVDVGAGDGVTDITGDPHGGDLRCGKFTVQTLVGVEFNGIGNRADG